MKNYLFLLSIVFFLTTVISAQTPRDEKAKNDIRAVMDAQAAAWNQGSVEGFMQGYWKSENLIFVSGDNVRRGWQGVTDQL